MDAFQLVINFGMLVLIWMVQLLIYPGFKYFETKNLIIWHQKYTRNMGVIVAPLMLVQLGIHIYTTYLNFNVLETLNLVLVIFTWVYTFVYFVPLHRKISSGLFKKTDLLQLENQNWWRTFVWSFIFILQLYIYIK